jgi:chromosomal replication initiation ATPase DnaA
MQQLLLDVKLKKTEKYLAEDFLPLANSFNAHRTLISALSNDLVGCLIFGSVESSGKTYLLNLANQYLNNNEQTLFLKNINDLTMPKNNIKYLLIDNIELLDTKQQELLFHWYNHLKDTNGKMFLVIANNLDELVTLKDLKSRLLTLQQAILETTTDKDIEIFILKLAFDKQVEISQDVLNYIILRTERNFKKIESLMDKIDDESLREKRKITIPFVKEFLD